jgi:uracil-DNA glycosylase family 4
MPDRFSLDCRDCPRLSRFLDQVRLEHPDYHARPVPVFGDAAAALLIVGLAPGMHGANRTGRPFTGDHAGILLYRTLHEFGFATQPVSERAGDSMRLNDCRISNAVKCLPPQNKPLPEEIRCCNRYLAAEMRRKPPRVVLALGSIAHQSVLMACGLKRANFRFGHHAIHELPPLPGSSKGIRLYDSYHCSRYNTQTKRLTENMFRAVFGDIAADLRTP